MSDNLVIRNAVIEYATITTAERGLLTAYLGLHYGDSGQAFGGFTLYLPQDWAHYKSGLKHNFAGHFIFRCLQIAGVDDWSKLPGRTLRAQATFSKIHAIGHILKDDWFDPETDFDRMKASAE